MFTLGAIFARDSCIQHNIPIEPLSRELNDEKWPVYSGAEARIYLLPRCLQLFEPGGH